LGGGRIPTGQQDVELMGLQTFRLVAVLASQKGKRPRASRF
jgi:hypothetical protein